MKNQQAVTEIAKILNATEWDVAMLDDIAEVIRNAGYEVGDVEESREIADKSFVVHNLSGNNHYVFKMYGDLNEEGELKAKIRACIICHMQSIGEGHLAYEEEERERYMSLVEIGSISVGMGDYTTML